MKFSAATLAAILAVANVCCPCKGLMHHQLTLLSPGRLRHRQLRPGHHGAPHCLVQQRLRFLQGGHRQRRVEQRRRPQLGRR